MINTDLLDESFINPKLHPQILSFSPYASLPALKRYQIYLQCYYFALWWRHPKLALWVASFLTSFYTEKTAVQWTRNDKIDAAEEIMPHTDNTMDRTVLISKENLLDN